jgi:DNA helicase-2/ATP-dependent DNA helicase PcrA
MDPSGPSPNARLLTGPADVPAGASEDLASLASALSDCLEGEMPAASQVERIGRFLQPIFVRRYTSPRERERDVEQLAALASRSPSRARFLTDLTLDPPVSTGDLAGPPHLDEDYLILSTIHSAKGLEWDVVHVIHAADGMIPSDMATGHPEEIEEERRLLYVAMTRAKDALHVYFPLRYYHRPRGLTDKHSYAQLSRFIPPSVRGLFEERTSGARGPEDQDPDAIDLTRQGDPVGAFLSSLWEG